MARLSLLLILLVAVAGGCTTVHDRGYDSDRYTRRVRSDVERYVRWMDEDLQLSRSEAQRIERLLESRTRHLLARTDVWDHSHVYPFPRGDRRSNAVRRKWWRDADRHIGRVLPDRKADRYYEWLRDERFEGNRDGWDEDDWEEDDERDRRRRRRPYHG